MSLLKISNSWEPSNFQISFCCHVSFKWGYIQISAKNFPGGNELCRDSRDWKPTWWLLNFLNLCRGYLTNTVICNFPSERLLYLHLNRPLELFTSLVFFISLAKLISGIVMGLRIPLSATFKLPHPIKLKGWKWCCTML